MRFRDNFSNNFETSDDNIYSTLKTRYYRSRTNESFRTVKDLINEEKGVIRDENEQFMEILFEAPGYSCTAKITSITPVEVAIDFLVITYSLISFGKGKKIIERFYKYLDSKLSFKGIGLFKGQ